MNRPLKVLGTLLISSTALALSLSGCSDDSTETSSNSLSGSTAIESTDTASTLSDSAAPVVTPEPVDTGSTLSDSAETEETAPTPVTSVTSTPVTPTRISARLDRNSNNIQVSWTALADSGASYRVYFTEDGTSPTQTSSYSDVYQPAYVHTALQARGTYTFRISAWLNNHESELSTSFTVVNSAPVPATTTTTSESGG